MKIRRILCWLLSLALLTGSIYTADTLVRQRRLARKTVRLHVIANSDEAADQEQKLRVRDGVLACVSGLTADCETADDARKCIAAHLPEIAEAAQHVLAGSGYDVTVSLGPETYGTRDYASFSLPAGTYPSLRVQIGEAAGKNWWCVVFPTLCTAATSDEAELQAAAGGFDEDEAAWITEEQPEYRIGVPIMGTYEEIFTSDKSEFGGSGITNGKVKTDSKPLHGQEQSINIKIPRFGVLFFKGKPKAKRRTKAEIEAAKKLAEQEKQEKKPARRTAAKTKAAKTAVTKKAKAEVAVKAKAEVAVKAKADVAVKGETSVVKTGTKAVARTGPKEVAVKGEKAVAIKGEKAVAVKSETAVTTVKEDK